MQNDDERALIDSIFLEAAELPEPQRTDFLDSRCAGLSDAARQQITELLAANEFAQEQPPTAANPFFNIADWAKDTDDEKWDDIGDFIGPYRILKQLGEGGMGIVFMAEQVEPVRRQVALKVIKKGMDSKQIVARFEAERQALAMMDHPNIAKVYDVGTTDAGRPYFVMELVDGIPITKYCIENKLTIEQRLLLFASVCSAIQHSHQKGIIHRDIKPSNVLVARFDNVAIPKVIDFGLAKALQQTLTEKTLFTQHGQMLGTFEYMSPEQAQLNQDDVDTRTDVYSLGVLLYELLTGFTPLDSQELRKGALDQLLHLIREIDPPVPSERLSSHASSSELAQSYQTRVDRLLSTLKGDLDAIAMMALNKERSSRYQTAESLKADVERYLNSVPIMARRPSVVYRVRKFVRRNRGLTVSVSAIFLSLVLGLIGTGLQWQRARLATSNRALLYVSDIGLAHREWEQNALSTMGQYLSRHIPDNRSPDLRSFEWYFLWRTFLDSSPSTLLKPNSAGIFTHPTILPGNQPRIAAVDGDDLRIWELDGDNELKGTRKFPIPCPEPFVACSENGRFFASVDNPSNYLYVSSLETGETTFKFDLGSLLVRLGLVPKDTKNLAHGSPWYGANGIVFSPDGSLLAVRSKGFCVVVFVVEEGGKLSYAWHHHSTELPLGFYSLSGIDFSHDNERFAIAHQKHVEVFDARTGKGSVSLEINSVPASIAFRPHSPEIVVASGNRLEIWTRDGKKLRQFDGSHDIRHIEASGDGRLLAVANGAFLELRDLEDNSVVKRLRGIIGRPEFAFAPAGNLLLTIDNEALKLWPFERNALKSKDDLPYRVLRGHTNGPISHISFHPHERKLASAGGTDATFRVWDIESGKSIAELDIDTETGENNRIARWVAFDKEGDEIITCGLGPWNITAWEWQTGQYERLFGGGRSAVSSVGPWFTSFGTIPGHVVLDRSSGKKIASLRNHERLIPYNNGLPSFSPVEPWLAAARLDGHAELLDVTTNEVQWTTRFFDAKYIRIEETEFSPDGELIAVAASIEGIPLIRAKDGKLLHTLSGHRNSKVLRISFSPDGRTLASIGDDGTLRLWDLHTYEQRFMLRTEGRRFSDVDFSPDGLMLAVSRGSDILIFRAATPAEVEQSLRDPMIVELLKPTSR